MAPQNKKKHSMNFIFCIQGNGSVARERVLRTLDI
jgi:hypothetical protein